MTSRPEGAVQLTLDLAYRPAMGRDSLLVTPANETAVAWIDSWPAWPANGLILCGPERCGKTHLAAVWQAKSGAIGVEGPSLDFAAIPNLLAAESAIVVEGAEGAEAKPLLHLLNGMAEERRSLLMTAKVPPAQWGVRLPDLKSRLLALPVASISAPDDLLLQAVLMKRFADKGTAISAEAAAYLASRMERSFPAAEAVVERIDTAAIRARRAITLRFVQDLLRRDPEEDH